MGCFPLNFLYSLFILGFHYFLYNMSKCGSLSVYLIGNSLSFLGIEAYVFHQILDSFLWLFSLTFLFPFTMALLPVSELSGSPEGVFIFLHFFLCSSDCIISINISSSLLILFSASSNLLLSPLCEFLISAIILWISIGNSIGIPIPLFLECLSLYWYFLFDETLTSFFFGHDFL